MSESRTDTSGTGPAEGGSEHERDKEEFEAATSYQPATNQARDEPLPASHHDEGGEEAGRRRGEPERDDPADRGQAGGRPAGGGDNDRGQSGRDEKGQGG